MVKGYVRNLLLMQKRANTPRKGEKKPAIINQGEKENTKY